MAVTITHLTLTDDHTSRTAAEVMACLQLDQGSPEEKQKCDRLLRDLDFPSEHQNEEEYSQFVFLMASVWYWVTPGLGKRA